MDGHAAPQDTRERKKTRVPDGSLTLFDGKLVNRNRMAELLQCPPERITKMINLPDGMPHIRLGEHGRLWFDPDAVLAWFKQHETQANPTTAPRRRK